MGAVLAIHPVPTITIAPGVHMPMVGIGTWEYNDTVAQAAVESALDIGYTAVDTAFVYGNAKGVGNAIKNFLVKSGKPRSSLFVTSKVMTGVPGAGNLSMYDLALQNMADMQLDYVDLYLLHFPCAPTADSCNGGVEFRQDQWKSVEGLVANKKARAIGVSHYCRRQMEDIFKIMTVKPAVNQVEYHVGMGMDGVNATDFKEWNQKNGITYQSFSPLCGPCNSSALIDGPLVVGIGKNHNKTGAQVSLKWQVQQGIPVIPKSASTQHQSENIDLFSWELTTEEMNQLTAATAPPVSGGPGPTDSGDCGIP